MNFLPVLHEDFPWIDDKISRNWADKNREEESEKLPNLEHLCLS